MTLDEAMTELLEALADTTADADEQRTSRVAAAFYEAWKADHERGWQARLVAKTGRTRETIRRHVEDERIRRGEIAPTKRYLDTLAKRAKRES